jgi:hypothetical protein
MRSHTGCVPFEPPQLRKFRLGPTRNSNEVNGPKWFEKEQKGVLFGKPVRLMPG